MTHPDYNPRCHRYRAAVISQQRKTTDAAPCRALCRRTVSSRWRMGKSTHNGPCVDVNKSGIITANHIEEGCSQPWRLCSSPCSFPIRLSFLYTALLFYCRAHHAARAQPLPVGYLGQRRVQAVDVVGGRAGVAAQQLPSVFTHSAELHVVVLLLAHCLLFLLVLVFGLPLDTLLLL